MASQSSLHVYQKMNTLQAHLQCFWMHLECSMLNIYGMENECLAEAVDRNEMSILCPTHLFHIGFRDL